jgi:hypothetical protein
MLAITILSFIGMVLSFIQHARENKIDMNLLFPAILSISLWENYIGTAITVIAFTGLVMLVNFATRD